MLQKLALLLLISLHLSACYRLQINNGIYEPNVYESIGSATKRYYHQALFEAVPVSQALALSQDCSLGRWQSVLIQKTPLNVLLSLPTAYLYSQWTIQSECLESTVER